MIWWEEIRKQVNLNFNPFPDCDAGINMNRPVWKNAEDIHGRRNNTEAADELRVCPQN